MFLKFRVALLLLIIFVVLSSVILFAFRYDSNADLDVVAVNDIAQSVSEHWGNLNDLPGKVYNLDYVVLDSENHFVTATKIGLNVDINSAVRNRDTIVDINRDSKVIGKLIIYNNTKDMWHKYRDNLLTFSLVILILVGALCVLYVLHIDRFIFNPFRKLQSFARHVAAGNLDVPIEMDKGNVFGAFTESFDLMREQLYLARENERLANQSKKELVASLSHDIKTPVASIIAVSELLSAKTEDENQKEQLRVINQKADQINILITNMFNATLEELQELKVSVTEKTSDFLYDLVKNADYNNKVSMGKIPECIIKADVTRLAQVIDNIISNSYKYAGTSMEIHSKIIDDYLEITFKDYGKGVPEDEIPLIWGKFYRAKNAEGISGTGLGLYISKYLINKMSGDIECKNNPDGFSVILKLSLA